MRPGGNELVFDNSEEEKLQDPLRGGLHTFRGLPHSSTPPPPASSTPADQRPPEHKIMYGTAKKTWELPPAIPGNSAEPAARPPLGRHL